jgi:hypothetical protein
MPRVAVSPKACISARREIDAMIDAAAVADDINGKDQELPRAG